MLKLVKIDSMLITPPPPPKGKHPSLPSTIMANWFMCTFGDGMLNSCAMQL